MSDAPLLEPNADRRVQRVLWITLGLNVAVALGKILVGTSAHALAVRADGFHSLTDGLNNVVALVAAVVAARPPDAGHPYGHRRYEVFGSLLIGLSLVGMAWSVLHDGLARLQGTAELPQIDGLVLGTLVATLAVNVFVATWEHAEGKRLQSSLLLSDAVHTRSDVVVTLGVLLGSLLVRAGHPMADTVGAFVVAGFIAWAGVGVLRQNLAYLADVAVVRPEQVIAAACAVPGVLGAHHVRSRGTPGHVFVDLHVEIDGATSLERAHAITHDAMRAIRQAVPTVTDVTIHTEPVTSPDHDASEHGPPPPLG